LFLIGKVPEPINIYEDPQTKLLDLVPVQTGKRKIIYPRDSEVHLQTPIYRTKEFNGQIRCMGTLYRAEREGFGVPDINGRNV
jgi:hypothetical protein